jgi:amino acid transporter
MSSRTKYVAAWLSLLALALAIFAVIAVPVWLIQPFAPQTERALQISYFLKSWSPILTIVALLASTALMIYIWRNSKRWFGKPFLFVPFAVVLVCVWFARQNHFEWMFNPLAQIAFARVSETDFVADDDMVLAVKINGEAVAYPVRQMAYHHVVADVVGGKPITATY